MTPSDPQPTPETAAVECADGRGWFADWDREAASDYGWQPCLETGNGHIPSFEVWFKTKAECEEWIAANVIDVGWFPGEPTEGRPTDRRKPVPPKPVDGRTDPCPTPGYAGRHAAVGAGAISPPYRCHGCGTWFTLPELAEPTGDDA